MGKMKKILCMLLVCAIVIVPSSVLGNISAQTTDSEPLKIEVTTDKSSYNAYGIAEITVNVTNTSTETINNISAEAVFNDLAPVGKNNETFKEVETLKSGESFSFSYKATVNSNKVKLNFFEKIILWFVRLFNGGYTATEHDISVEIEEITNIKFGSNTVKNCVIVGHKTFSHFSTKDVENRQKVLTSLSDLMSSEEYQRKEDTEKKDLVENLLSELEKDGLVNNVSFNSDTKYFHYNFTCGGKGSVSIKSETKYSDPSLNPVGLTDNNSTTLIRQNETNIITNSNSNTSTNAILMYGFDKPYDENRQFDYWYNSCESKINMQTAVLDCPTVYEFKTELLNKDFICIFEHGNYGDIVDNTYVFKVQNEEITEDTDFAYDTDLYFERIVTHTDNNGERFYCITPKFFELYYKNKLNDAIVYLNSCQGFGRNTIFDYGIAETLIEQCGAKTVVGFHNTVAQNYTYRIYNEITDLLLKGFTIGEAYNRTIDKLGVTDYTFLKEHLFEVEDMSTRRNWLEVANEKQETGNVATFLLYGDESATLITPANLTGTVKDETTGYAISGVTVEVIDNSSGSLDPVMTTTTDENGQFSINLPYGDYSISFNHENYEDYGTSLTVDSDYVVLNNPILLTRKTTLLKSTVKDKETDVPIAGVIIEAIDNESGSLTPVATATTDENGQFSIRVPYGNNSLSFTHEDYEYYEKTASINSDNHLLVKLLFQAEPILLTAKNKPIEAVAFLGRNISEVINYYGDYYLDTSIEGGHAFCFNDFIFVITENAYAGLEPQNVVSIISGNTNAILYNGLHSNMSYNDLIKIVPDIEKPQYYYDEIDDEVIYSTTFKYGNYVFNYRWKDYYPSDDEICWEVIVNIAEQTQTCITQMEIVDHGQYTGNEGDSCIFHLDKNGLPGIHNTYYAFGNVGIDETVYENGIEAWIARWNNTSEISWAYATYKLDSKYTTLTGKTDLIKSNNIDNFNTTVYFYDGDKLLASYTLTNEDYKKDINVDVTGVDELKILVQDNVAVKKGTSYALYDMFLT